MVSIIQKLPVERWREYKQLRLDALQDCPFAFQEDYETAAAQPDSYWQDILTERFVYFAEIEGTLVGTAGFFRKPGPKQAHVVVMVGVYVRPETRGQGVAGKLIAAIEQSVRALPGVRKITLAVTSAQMAARHLYQKLGFVEVGVRKEHFKVGERFFDEYMMEKFL